MKRLSLKATSLILALVLALSLSVTAFADDNAASMTRAEVTQEVIKNMGLAAQAEASAKDASAFKDVAEGSKFEGAINLAYSKGIVNGVSKDAFAPDAAVTQLEAAAGKYGRDDPPALFRGRAADGWYPASGGCTACAAGVGGRGRF